MKLVAKCLVTNPSGKILIVRRSDTHPKFALQPDLPGGEVDHGETADQAVVRELFEEAGLTIDQSRFLQVLSQQHSDECTYLLYVCTIDEEDPAIALSWEHDAYYWKTKEELLAEELPKNVDSYYQMVIDYLSRTT